MKNVLVTSVMLALAAAFLALPLHAQDPSSDQPGRLLAAAPQSATPDQARGDRRAPTPASLAADPVIYDNGVTPNTGLSSQLDTAYPFNSQVADDFTLPTGDGSQYGVTGISFQGVYFNDPPSGPGTTDFNVLFYADDGTGTAPVGGGLPDPTGSAFAVRTVLSAVGVNVGTETWDWTLDWSGNAVAVSPNTQYWVAVQWIGNFPPQWGWRADNTGGNAVQGFPLLSIPYWTPGTFETDFQLHGIQPVPVELQKFSIE